MSRREYHARKWVAATQRRRQARLEGRLEAALDILDATLVHPSRPEIERLKCRASHALERALRSLR